MNFFKKFKKKYSKIKIKEECILCLNNIKKKDDIHKLTCNHIFHKNCMIKSIVEWIKEKDNCKYKNVSIKGYCPICKTNNYLINFNLYFYINLYNKID